VTDAILHHLERLVAFDTRNPPRAIAADGGVFSYLREALPGFTHTLTDYGAGAITLMSVRGKPSRLFNFHLDTVPASEGWTTPPHQLRLALGRAYGLGACDIKGAVAAMLAAVAKTSGDVALLFSSDEEANDPRCISGFLSTQHRFSEAIIAEPTHAQAVLAHRGIVSAEAHFAGIAGHASEARALDDSAVHRASRWIVEALAFARSRSESTFGTLQGLPFNIGRIEGGIKGNIIASQCVLRFGFRPLPSQSVDEFLATFRGMAAPCELASMTELFRGPPLPAGRGDEARQQLDAARALATTLGLPVREAVNFWTEAALFSAAGLTAIVYGPGDIAQAHTVDEWVALDQLAHVEHAYERIIG
jgi:acetylornithine deacetylase